MRALRVTEHGGPEVLKISEVERQDPGHGEVEVHIHAAGLNHLDCWVRKGVPGHKFPLPMILGSDGAGVVERVGPGVAGVQVGDRVALSPGYSPHPTAESLAGDHHLARHYAIFGETRDGTCAEYLNVPAGNLLPVPEEMELEDAAAIPLAALTAHHMLVRRCGIRPGMDVLIHAAGSGVSIYAIQIAKLYGARVLVTSSSHDKLSAAADLGATTLIDYANEDFLERVKATTHKAGVDIVVDHVGEATIGKSLRCLKKGGSVVTCGATSGPKLEADLRLIFFKSLSILGSTMGGMGEMREVWNLVQRGLIRPVVDRVLPMSRAADAHRALEGRETFGKVILLPGE